MDIEDQEEKEASDEVNAWRSNFFPCLLESQSVFKKKKKKFPGRVQRRGNIVIVKERGPRSFTVVLFGSNSPSAIQLKWHRPS